MTFKLGNIFAELKAVVKRKVLNQGGEPLDFVKKLFHPI